MSAWRSLVCLVVLASPMTGCDFKSMGQQRAEPRASSAPPKTILVGPQPGPDAPQSIVNPYKGDELVLQDGRKLFVVFNCSGCHGGHAGGGMGPSLRDVTWIYGNSDAQIFDSIAAGRAHGMPAWGLRLPAQQIWKLVAYIESLGTADEPEPPT